MIDLIIADDHVVLREALCELLETKGDYHVLAQASDGEELLNLLHSHTPDLIILDMTMPNMGGEETFGELRKIQGDIPVIISSGYNEQEVTDHFAGKELAGFIHKPYTIDQMIGTIQRILSKETASTATSIATEGEKSF